MLAKSSSLGMPWAMRLERTSTAVEAEEGGEEAEEEFVSELLASEDEDDHPAIDQWVCT